MTGRCRSLLWPALLLLLTGVAVAWFAFHKADRSEEDYMTKAPSTAVLESGADTRVFFGHQSVGMNILDALPGVYAGSAVAPPAIVESDTAPQGPAWVHAFLGQNGDPDGKLADFESLLADGYAAWADVALMKFCYVDITADTDVDALFARYEKTLSRAEATYPDITFLYMTVPLTTPPSVKERVKSALGRPNSMADNAARERFNALVRDRYADSGRLFDLAAIESTAPDGSRVSGTVKGQPYYALYPGFASDEGHLTPQAAEYVAAQLLEAVAQAR